MARDEYQSPSEKRTCRLTNAANMENLLSPRFRSVAAMAGWDEETLLLATMIVEDTPEREPKHKRRTNQQLKTPPASSRRKRRAQQQNPSLIPVGAICLDDEVNGENVVGNGKKNAEVVVNEEKKEEGGEGSLPAEGGCSSSIPAVPCMDRLREELSCAICLEICFEPSTTTCGHSFCKGCLKSAADKCGKRCPKCRQLISNGRSCTVNTVLWNTIQLLFPDEVEARKAATNLLEAKKHRNAKDISISTRNVTVDDSDITGSSNRRRRSDSRPAEEVALTSSRRNSSWRRTRRGPSQEEDAALAFRLQREEFVEAFGGIHDHEPRRSMYSARSNLRAMELLRLRGR